MAIHKRFLVSAAIQALFVLSLNNSSAGEKCRSDTPYYFSEFNPTSWKVESELNYEEVYKNFEYFEVIFNRTCDEITVKKYRKGRLNSSEIYQVNPDGSLTKKASN